MARIRRGLWRNCGIAAALLFSTPAWGQVACFPRDQVVSFLEGEHKEAVTGMGISRDGVVELWASESGTFTVTMTLPSGMTCPLVDGNSWEAIAPVKGQPS